MKKKEVGLKKIILSGFGIGLMLLASAPTASAVLATGGNVTNSGAYTIHTFTNIGVASNFVVTTGGAVDVLVVAGGGQGGWTIGGGGGAGGVIYTNSYVLSAGTNTVVVGVGGSGGGSWVKGTSGSNSSFGPLIAYGGGGGGGWNSGPGLSGGSGGGGSQGGAPGTNSPSNGQGKSGGTSTSRGAGGGGGFVSAGIGGTGTQSGGGGTGVFYDISGVSTNYAGGGGGGSDNTGGPVAGGGGPGGGGAGGGRTSVGSNGAANTGGGGGGGGFDGSTGYAGGSGGSGIVIVRYLALNPIVNNLFATNVAGSSVTLMGSLLSTGRAPTTVRVYWGTNDGNTNLATWGNTNDFGTSSPGALSTNLTGLAPNTLYFYRFYATNAYGESWATQTETWIAGALTLNATDANASEVGPDPATFQVVRPDWATNVALRVNYTVSGTASNGVNYSNLTGNVTIPVGSTNATITVTPINDNMYEGPQTVNLALAPGAYIIGSPSNDTATIADAQRCWYVAPSPGGSDVNGGTGWSAAFATISNGVAHAISGDTVLVSNGTYQLAVQISITNAITVTSLNGPDVTVIRGPGTLLDDTHRCLIITNTVATVSGFTISNGYAYYQGGGVYMTGGTLRNCKIIGNQNKAGSGDQRFYGGGGVSLWGSGGGTVRNCLIAGNSVNWLSGSGAGGGGIDIKSSGGIWRIENCTIVRNEAPRGAAGIFLYSGSATVTNCIVYYNNAAAGNPTNWAGVNMSYSCTTPTNGLTGAGNTSLDPALVNSGTNYGLSWTGGDLRLTAASPCVDTGGSLAAEFTDDLVGTIRPQDGDGNGTATWDMGAYELPNANRPLSLTFLANRVSGFTPLAVVFTATVSGSDTNNLGFTWNFKNGVTNSGPGLFMVTNTFNAGDYTPTLNVTNGSGETVTVALVNPATVIRVSPPTVYASTNGLSQAPYDTWAKAATNIQNAVDFGYADGTTGTLVLVSNGVYSLASQISVTKGLTLRSVNGPALTTFNGRGSLRVFSITDSAALIDGFSITNGYDPYNGGGVYMTGGSLWNCKITGNRSHGGTGDANLYGGGGVQLDGAGSGTFRNCLIAGNHVDELGFDSGGGGGIHVKGSGSWRFENCTIARNFAAGHASNGSAGGILCRGGTVTLTNCIVYQNAINRGGTTVTNWSGVNMSYSCALPTNGLTGPGNTPADPVFMNSGINYGLNWTGGDLRPGGGSPCVNTGTNASWMDTAKDLNDLPRKIGSRVDMGAYEQQSPGSMYMFR